MPQTLLKTIFFLIFILLQTTALSQTVPDKLAAAFAAFENDSQLRHGIASLYVVEAKTGKVIFERNAKLGLVPASTLKVITSATAYEILGNDFRYKTKFAIRKNAAETDLIILPSGDPTLGSWRWQHTRQAAVLNSISLAVRKSGIKRIHSITVDNSGWNAEIIPDGWLWQDIGNYYGAGAGKLNWHENQFDVILRSGKKIGDPVTIVRTKPAIYGYSLRSEVTAAAPGSGDSAYIYFPLQGTTATIRGTIPINKSAFEISGAIPDPATQFVNILLDTLSAAGITSPPVPRAFATENVYPQNYTIFHTLTSPSLDSIVYFFNRKSINLYGEALLKTMAFKRMGTGATGIGVAVVQDFWKQKGIAEAELNIYDGSGLSPLNRVTTHAQVRVLQYAQKQPWYGGFYRSLPEYNGMKMKSGTMQGVKGFCGYYRDKSGNEYIFSFLVNNYSGSSAAITHKMYRVLNALK